MSILALENLSTEQWFALSSAFGFSQSAFVHHFLSSLPAAWQFCYFSLIFCNFTSLLSGWFYYLPSSLFQMGGFYSGFGVLGFWQTTAIKCKRFGSRTDGKCRVVCFHSWWLPAFSNRREHRQHWFPALTSDRLKQDWGGDWKDWGFAVPIVSGGWNLREKSSVDT